MTSLSFQDSKFKTEEKSGISLIKINDQETEIFLLATKESLWGKVWKMAGFPVFSLFQYNFHFLLPTFISQLFQYIGNLTMKDFSPPVCLVSSFVISHPLAMIFFTAPDELFVLPSFYAFSMFLRAKVSLCPFWKEINLNSKEYAHTHIYI